MVLLAVFLSLMLPARCSLVETEKVRMDARLHRIERRFDEVSVAGALDNFASAHALDIVLDDKNSVRAKKFISSLTPSAQSRLRSECVTALNWEFLSDWYRVRSFLDTESEPFLVPVSERLSPLAATRSSLRKHVFRGTHIPEALKDPQSEIIRILYPYIRNGRAISHQVFAQVNEEIKYALEEADKAAVAQMLDEVEATLSQQDDPVPEYLREEFEFVDAQIRRIEAELRRNGQ